MLKKKLLASTVLGGVMIFGAAVLAQVPPENIDPARHPDLAEAQHHIQQAVAKIDQAQRANRDQLGGHAQKAKDLLDQADHELKAAAEFADHHH
jgi:hypothetical protein